MRARIYQPPKTAMQSGRANTDHWVLDYGQAEARRADPMMGWSGSADTQAQVRLKFDSKAEAVAYAERMGIPYDVETPMIRQIKPKAYADNFRSGRLQNWTH